MSPNLKLIDNKYLKNTLSQHIAEAMLSEFQSEWYLPYIKDEYKHNQFQGIPPEELTPRED